MKSEELKGKRLAVFGANNVVDEVTAYARKHGIVLVSVGNVPEAPIHQVSDEQYYMDSTDEAAMLRFFKEKHIDGLLSCSGEMVIRIKGIDAVRQLPYVYSLYQYYHEGDTMQYTGLFLQALCRIFVRANSRQELHSNINTVLGLIEVGGADGNSLLRDYPSTSKY